MLCLPTVAASPQPMSAKEPLKTEPWFRPLWAKNTETTAPASEFAEIVTLLREGRTEVG